MPGTDVEEASVVLPQRQPRLKRRRTAEVDHPAEAEAADAADAAPSEPPGAAAAGESGGAAAAAPPADREPEAGGDAGATEGGDLDLPAYRSAVVPGQKFECKSRAAAALKLEGCRPFRAVAAGVLSESIHLPVHPSPPMQT